MVSLHEGGGLQVDEVTCLGRVIRLSILSLASSPHLSCKLNQIKTRRSPQLSRLHHPPGVPNLLAPVVQTSDSAIHRINHYPVDKY